MVANQLVDFIENGNITNSVNYPAVKLEEKFDNKVLVLFDAEKVSAEQIVAGFKAEKSSSGV